MNLRNFEVLLEDPLARLALLSIVLLAIASAVTFTLRCKYAGLRRSLWAAFLIGQLCAAPLCLLRSGLQWLPRDPLASGISQLPSSTTPPRIAAPMAGDSRKGVESLAVGQPAPISVVPQDDAISPRKPLAWRSVAYVCWFVGATLVFVRVVVGLTLCCRRGWNSEVETPRVLLSPGCRSRLRLLRCKDVTSPSAWGLFSPLIVLPSDACRWSARQRRFVLLHEMVHIRRNDSAVLLLAHCSCAVFWFNPLTWLGYYRLRAAIEHSCDDEVVRASRAPKGYAEALLAVANGAAGSGRAYEIGMADGPLLVRVQQILDQARKRNLPNGGLQRLYASLVVSAAVILASTRPSAPHAVAANPSDSPVRLIQDRSGKVLFDQKSAEAFPFGSTAAQLLYGLRWQDTGDAQVQLTIDLRLQQVVEKALRRVRRGGAVLLDPNTGDVLALASVPTFLPGRIVEDWDKLSADPLNPLMNRALSATSLGAAFLPVTALAGGLKGKWDMHFQCAGGVSYGNTMMPCWQTEGHGELGLGEALAQSCDAYFYQYGNACGIDNIVTVGEKLGLGQRSWIAPGESAGLLPSVKWLRRIAPDQRWSAGYTAHIATGRPPVEASPLQMAVVASAIGTRGLVFEPRLNTNRPPRLHANLIQVGVDARVIEIVRESMRDAVSRATENQGEGRQAGASIAGQMGLGVVRREITPRQFVSETDAWFIGFAPYEHPRFAIAVCVEGDQSEGRDSASLALQIFREAFSPRSGSDDGTIVDLKPEGKPTPRLKWGEVVTPETGDRKYVEIDLGQTDLGEPFGGYPNPLVCTEDGVIGYVTEIRDKTSKVVLIGRGGAAMPAIVVNERNETIGEGMIGAAPDEPGRSIVELLLQGAEARIKVGDLVKTSDKGGIFPKGKVIGRVIEIRTGTDASPGRVQVELAANLNQLTEIAVAVP